MSFYKTWVARKSVSEKARQAPISNKEGARALDAITTPLSAPKLLSDAEQMKILERSAIYLSDDGNKLYEEVKAIFLQAWDAYDGNNDAMIQICIQKLSQILS